MEHNGGTTLDGARNCAPLMYVRSMEELNLSSKRAMVLLMPRGELELPDTLAQAALRLPKQIAVAIREVDQSF